MRGALGCAGQCETAAGVVRSMVEGGERASTAKSTQGWACVRGDANNRYKRLQSASCVLRRCEKSPSRSAQPRVRCA
eukprot:5528230-Prymnesium_polylepis.2